MRCTWRKPDRLNQERKLMNGQLSHAITVFLAFFAIMNPVANTPLFISLTEGDEQPVRRQVAFQSVLIAFFLVLLFCLFGKLIFEMFGAPISTYTRADAIDDGTLVDVSTTAAEAGFRVPVALTRALWEDAVAWEDADSKRKRTHQDEAGRLWDVVWMGFLAFRAAVRENPSGPSLIVPYTFYRVPRKGTGHMPRLMHANLHAGPGDKGELVISIMLPGED